MNNPKISIIIPVYNVENYIADCLESVISQTYKGAIEVLIVDDKGQDSSIAIAEKIISNYRGPIQFRIIKREKNGGLSAARNTGIENSSGDYLFFLDSDDVIKDICMESLVKPLSFRLYDIVVGLYYTDNGSEKSALRNVLINTGYDGPDVIQSYLENRWYVMAWNKLCKKDFIIKNKLYFGEGLIHEDVLWSYLLACTASSLFVISDVTYYYRIRPNSIMTSIDYAKRFTNMKRITEEMCMFIEARDLYQNKGANYGLQRWFISAMRLINNWEGYFTLRDLFKTYGIKPIRVNYLSAKQALLCLHWFLPKTIGFYYFKLTHYFLALK